MKLEKSAAIVTGGASGLGEATVRALVAAGARVTIVDRQHAEGEHLAGELGPSAIYTPADITSEAEVSDALRRTVDVFGAVHVLVNCAGTGAAAKTISKTGPMPLELFAKVIEINLVGTFNVIRLVAARMAANTPDSDGERGVIINTASVAAFEGQIGQVPYAASKAGVVGMTLPLARELSSLGIRCCSIAPGSFDTPLLAMMPESQRQTLVADNPFPPRLGHPSEFAALVCHIAENTMLNGETIRLDAGLRMPPR